MIRKPALILTGIGALIVLLALTDLSPAGTAGVASAVGGASNPPPCADGEICLQTGDFSPVSVDTDTGVTYPSGPAFGALVYDPDFKTIERAARARLKRGLDARLALSPYRGNLDFDTYPDTHTFPDRDAYSWAAIRIVRIARCGTSAAGYSHP